MAPPHNSDPAYSTSFAGRRVLVVGLGRFGGGVGVTQWLAGQGARVTVTDHADGDTLTDSIRAIADCGVDVRLGDHDPGDLENADLVIVNPAVDKRHSALFQAVLQRGILWTTEINLFCARCPALTIGVTGSYGKSTTCAMLGEALGRWCESRTGPYRTVHLGGNIGRSLLTDLHRINPEDLVVLELSNAQLEDLPRINWAPPIALITNLHPHHLDRHGGFDGYLTAKLNICRDPQRTSRIFVGSIDAAASSMLERLVEDTPDRVHCVSSASPPVELRVPGRHNQANAAAALAVCLQLGADERLIRSALGDFRGLPHRLEFVCAIRGVDYINDSKSTSPATTLAAVEALGRPAVVIMGGRGLFAPQRDWTDRMLKSVKTAICTGESGAALAAAFREVVPANGPTIQLAGNLADSVRLAAAGAEAGDVVLFSPGAPSFDQYANFAERGRHFTDLVLSTRA